MVREAEAHAEADKVNRERVEAINQAEAVLHDTESKMEEFKDQLPSEDVSKMKEKIAEVGDCFNENGMISFLRNVVDSNMHFFTKYWNNQEIKTRIRKRPEKAIGNRFTVSLLICLS